MLPQLLGLLGLLGLVVFGASPYAFGASASVTSVVSAATDTVHVAPPTGTADSDRGSILGALEALEPGGTLLFAPGTYRIGGAFLRVPVPDMILQGHPDGTTLLGCEPADLFDPERMTACNGLELTGPRQTIRGFTFEQIGSALWVGCCLEPAAPDLEGGQPHVGGHLIEGNTFRGTWNGIRVIGDSPEATVIRDNDFVNTWHAVTVNGRTAHILGNRVSVPDPEQVPVNGHAGIAIAVSAYDTRLERAFTCAGNVIAGNRIEGHPEAIGIFAFRSGASCRENVIRGNTVVAARVRMPGPSWLVIGIREEDDSTLAGVPIALADLSVQMEEFLGLPAGDHDEELLQENRVEGNHVTGAEGLAIQLVGASRNRIVGNTIAEVRRREPFPGNTMIDDPEPWRDANGSGIWVSPGSDGNEIVGNTFEGIASHAVFLEGDSNHVGVRSDADAVRDLGTGNRVDAPGTTTPSREIGEVAHESKFVQVRGIRMHYLDFGGSGLPVIFIHGSHGNARSFADFAPRFADGFRVLALDRRGYGESEDVDWGHGTAAQGEDVLGFMDALGLERAVLIGNVAGPTGLMVYLGEHHPDRLAGMVYLTHMAPEVESRRDSFAAEFWDMGSRTACDWDEETRQRNTQRDGYRPHFIDDPDFRIDVPALSLANAEGTRYPADFDFVGIILQQVETAEWCDPTAKAYFAALAADTPRADELRTRLGDLSGTANLGTFEGAFGPRMTIVRLSVPAVSGYEYQGAPDLIYPHIRTFLEGLTGADP